MPTITIELSDTEWSYLNAATADEDGLSPTLVEWAAWCRRQLRTEMLKYETAKKNSTDTQSRQDVDTSQSERRSAAGW